MRERGGGIETWGILVSSGSLESNNEDKSQREDRGLSRGERMPGRVWNQIQRFIGDPGLAQPQDGVLLHFSISEVECALP